MASNTLELWELANLTGDAHPIHLHFTQFQVLNRQKFDAGAYQSAAYGPGEVTRILVPFGPTAAGVGKPLAMGAAHTGEYLWHCRILEHEDNDMMQRFVIA